MSAISARAEAAGARDVPHKDIEKRRAAARERAKRYRAKHGDLIRARERAQRALNPEKYRKKCRDWLAANPEYRRRVKNEWSRKNPASVTASKRKRALGISRAEQEFLFASQAGRCRICNDSVLFHKAHLDHDHATMQIRGFLCGKCNSLLGFARDSESVLLSAVAYLRTARRSGRAWSTSLISKGGSCGA